MKKDNENGFSVVYGTVLLAIVLGIGLAGWYIWHLNQVKTNDMSPSAVHPSIVSTFQLPAGWAWYQGDGFKFTYPQAFGNFTATNTQYAGSGTQQLLISSAPKASLFPGLSLGAFVLSKMDSAGTPIVSRKYGPTVRLQNGKWIVTQDNPGDPKPYAVGATYPEVSVENNDGANVYTFTSSDEGGVIYTIAFVAKGHLYTLQLPEFDTGAYSAGSSLNNQRPYDQLVSQIAESISADK